MDWTIAIVLVVNAAVLALLAKREVRNEVFRDASDFCSECMNDARADISLR